MKPLTQPENISSAIRRNVEMVARLEEEARRKRNRMDRIADAIADFSGSMWFVAFHACFLWLVDPG